MRAAVSGGNSTELDRLLCGLRGAGSGEEGGERGATSKERRGGGVEEESLNCNSLFFCWRAALSSWS